MHLSAVRRERSGGSSRFAWKPYRVATRATSHCVATAVAQAHYVGLCFRMTPVIYAGTLRTLRRLHVETCIGSPAAPLTNGLPMGLVGAASRSLARARGRVSAQQRVGG